MSKIKHMLRETLARLDTNLADLSPTEQHELLDRLAAELEERFVQLIDTPEQQ